MGSAVPSSLGDTCSRPVIILLKKKCKTRYAPCCLQSARQFQLVLHLGHQSLLLLFSAASCTTSLAILSTSSLRFETSNASFSPYLFDRGFERSLAWLPCPSSGRDVRSWALFLTREDSPLPCLSADSIWDDHFLNTNEALTRKDHNESRFQISSGSPRGRKTESESTIEKAAKARRSVCPCSEFQSLGPPLLARAKWTAKPFLPWKAFRAKDYYEHRIAVPESWVWCWMAHGAPSDKSIGRLPFISFPSLGRAFSSQPPG